MSKRPFFLGATYFPKEDENRMKNVGDVVSARKDFLKNKPSNLAFLLGKRYLWMNNFIEPHLKGFEVGCGTGLSKQFIKSKNFMLTDYLENPWVEKKVNALKMPFKDSSFDYIVSSNMIHHLAKPHIFFNECSRVLKKGGKLIIQEINASLMMRMILKKMKHEGYSYDIDVYDKKQICNDKNDPWSANCAIPNLLFDNRKLFEENFPFKTIYHSYREFFIFPLSGGVIAKKKTINLPGFVLHFINAIDSIMVFCFRKIFPLQRRIVLENKK